MQIKTAIQNKQLLSFSYDGFPRTVEPHTYGLDKKGHPALRAYQIKGGSESGEYIGWKIFHVNEIHNLSVLQEHFAHARSDYKRNDSFFYSINAQLWTNHDR
jgi:hypothetical protein